MKTSEEMAQQAGALFDSLLDEAGGALFRSDGRDESRLIASRVVRREEGCGMAAVLRVVTPKRVHITLTDLDPPTALRVAKLLGEVLP